jgi:hypothetical protein
MNDGEFATRVNKFVNGAEKERAAESLRSYLDSFTGRHFEHLADSDADSVTANDIVAVSMLSVVVPAGAASWFLGDGAAQTSALLQKIQPANLEIWDNRADLSKSSPAWYLWRAVKDHKGVGRTTASKLLAAKRPHLFPIYDSVVSAALGIGRSDDWQLWQTFLRSDKAEPSKAAVQQLHNETSGSEHLSTLRTLDIIIWMRVHGYKSVQRLSHFARFPI